MGSLNDVSSLRLVPLNNNCVIQHRHLVGRLLTGNQGTNVIILCTPSKFKGASILLRCARRIGYSPAQNPIQVVRTSHTVKHRIFVRLRIIARRLGSGPRSLVTVSGIPGLSRRSARSLVSEVHNLHTVKVKIFVSYHPSGHRLVRKLNSSIGVGTRVLGIRTCRCST